MIKAKEVALLHVVLVLDRMNEGSDGISVHTDGLYHELLRQGLTCSILSREQAIDNTFFEKCAHDNQTVIHVNGLWTPFLHKIVRLAIKNSLPFVISPHGTLEPWALAHKYLKKKLAWHLYQKQDVQCANVIHATSKVESENMRDLGIVTPIALVPSATGLPDLKKVNNKIRTMLFLSRIHPVKGLLNLIVAWAQVRPAGWRLVIAGVDEDGHRQEVEQRVKYFGLEAFVQFVGPVFDDEKSNLYHRSDLFVLPSYSENFGLVIIEAMSYGLPVITTRAAPWSILQEKQCGWWVDVGVDPLIQALRQSTSLDSVQLEKMGAMCRDIIESDYTWSKVGLNMVVLYEWMNGNRTLPSFVVE